MPPFRPQNVSRFAADIQRFAQNGILKAMHEESQRTGDSVYVNGKTKDFAFSVAAKFIFGPLVNDEDIAESLETFKVYGNGFSFEGLKDPEAKDPNSVTSKAYAARDELIDYFMPKYLDAERLIADNEWETRFGEEADCIVRVMIANEAYEAILPEESLDIRSSKYFYHRKFEKMKI